MKLRCISISALPKFLASAEFKAMDALPISTRRGWAQHRNPSAQADDIVLILAYLNQRMVGYLGFLPDDIFILDKKIHLAWMSCIWVDASARGKGIARTMLQKGYECWEGKLLATEFTDPAKRLYDKLGWFDDLAIKEGLRCYLRFNLAVLLPTSRPKLKKLKPLLKIGDSILNIFNGLRLNFYTKKQYTQPKQLSQFDEESIAFIQKKNQRASFRRNVKVLEWLLENPWLGNQSQDQSDAGRYHFSVYSALFRFSILKIKKNTQVQAIVLLAERDRALKIPYCWLAENAEAQVVRNICNYMVQQKLNMLTLYQETLIPFLKKEKTPFYLKRTFKRHYLISKKIEKPDHSSPIQIQDGDGDCAFT